MKQLLLLTILSVVILSALGFLINRVISIPEPLQQPFSDIALGKPLPTEMHCQFIHYDQPGQLMDCAMYRSNTYVSALYDARSRKTLRIAYTYEKKYTTGEILLYYGHPLAVKKIAPYMFRFVYPEGFSIYIYEKTHLNLKSVGLVFMYSDEIDLSDGYLPWRGLSNY